MEDDYTHIPCQRWILSATSAVVARPGYDRTIICHVLPDAENQRRQNETATVSEYQDGFFLRLLTRVKSVHSMCCRLHVVFAGPLFGILFCVF